MGSVAMGFSWKPTLVFGIFLYLKECTLLHELFQYKKGKFVCFVPIYSKENIIEIYDEDWNGLYCLQVAKI